MQNPLVNCACDIISQWLTFLFLQGLSKTIPGAPEDQVPIHLRPRQKYAMYSWNQFDLEQRKEAREGGNSLFQKPEQK